MLNNALQMNDEDFMRAMESHEDQVTTETIEDTQVVNHENNETDTTHENDGSNEDTGVSVNNDETNQPSQEVDENNPNSDTGTEVTPPSDEQQETEPTEIDYKKFYETVTQDYKASGKTMPGVKEPEKFIKALQMATDYALKTAALKPALKRVKMLEEVSDEDLAEMLDFKKRNPEVIKKALKEANIDPVELDMDKVNYVPQVQMISDSEYDFRETVDELSKDVKFNDTRQLILSGLDAKSKELALTDTRVLKALHQEVVSGRIEQIQAHALQLKAFGGYNNVPDLELYAMIANEMDKQAMVSQPAVPSNPVQTGGMNPQVANTVQPNSVSKPNPELEDKRVRAGIQPKPSTTVVKKYDPTKLSDEEFMKLLEAGAEFIDR